MTIANHNYVALEHANIISKNYLTIQWLLGNTCNFSCSYCPLNLHDGSILWTDLENIKKFIIKLKNTYPTKTICIEFTGGEVTIFKDFIEVCKFCKDNGIFLKFLTNGSRTLRWWEENKHYFDSVVMSYHNEFADSTHFCNVIKILKDTCMVHTNIVMSLDKWDECINVANQIKDIGNCSVNLKPLKHEIAGELYPYNDEQISILKNQQSIFKNQIKWTKKIIPNIRGKMFGVDTNHNKIHLTYSELFASNTNTWIGWECWAGLEQLIIDIDGSIWRGWCRVGGKIGYINDENINFPKDTIICNKTFCGCASDVICTKRKPSDIDNS